MKRRDRRVRESSIAHESEYNPFACPSLSCYTFWINFESKSRHELEGIKWRIASNVMNFIFR